MKKAILAVLAVASVAAMSTTPASLALWHAEVRPNLGTISTGSAILNVEKAVWESDGAVIDNLGDHRIEAGETLNLEQEVAIEITGPGQYSFYTAGDPIVTGFDAEDYSFTGIKLMTSDGIPVELDNAELTETDSGTYTAAATFELNKDATFKPGAAFDLSGLTYHLAEIPDVTEDAAESFNGKSERS